MIELRNAHQRGHANLGWLDSRHTFSFADYYDPAHMGFRVLRVINEDRIAPGAGFPTHPHRDMEILTWVLSGELAHRDSMGNGSTIRPGELQRMTAGTGVAHSEFNASQAEPLHLLQIWIVPEAAGLMPAYEQKHFPEAARQGQLRLVAARGGREGAVHLNQDVDLYATHLAAGEQAELALRPDRHAWVQVTEGHLAVNGTAVAAGDGVAISGEAHVALHADAAGAALLFDLP